MKPQGDLSYHKKGSNGLPHGIYICPSILWSFLEYIKHEDTLTCICHMCEHSSVKKEHSSVSSSLISLCSWGLLTLMAQGGESSWWMTSDHGRAPPFRQALACGIQSHGHVPMLRNLPTSCTLLLLLFSLYLICSLAATTTTKCKDSTYKALSCTC